MASSLRREESALESVPNTGEPEINEDTRDEKTNEEIRDKETNEENIANTTQPEDDYIKYLPLYRAAVRGDWETANVIFQYDKEAVTAIINEFKQTALHVSTEMGKNIHFFKELVKLMPEKDLLLQDDLGHTALALAAIVGNTEAATILVKENRKLLDVRNNNKELPVTLAALYGHRQTVCYLLNAASSHCHNPFQETADLFFLTTVINTGDFGIALDLLEKYPHLATLRVEGFQVPLQKIANIPSAFRRGCKLKYWESLIYDGIPLSLLESDPNKNVGDVENPTHSTDQVLPQTNSWNYSHLISVMWQKFQITIWRMIIYLAPPIKQIKDKKLRHNRALQFVKLTCKKLEALNDPIYRSIHYGDALIEAAKADNPEVIEEIMETFPDAIWIYAKDNRRYMFHLAVLNRCENVFNLAYQMGGSKHRVMNVTDSRGNTIFHLAGKLANPHKLNLVSGPALQMQRELQWFKEVERWVNKETKDLLNAGEETKDLLNAGKETKELLDAGRKTPQMIFTEEHKNLVIEGEKWMRDTANSCAIVASLIVTIVFAAAITVPGGNNDNNGQPVLFKRNAFLIFAISDAISLFSSITSLLMFLAILTSRYAEKDFLYALPKKLIIGLVTLFLSITFMIIAFSSTLYLVFGRGENWVLFGAVILASLPITSFVFLQFPLLVDLISSTYGPGIFGKRSDRPFL